MVKEFIGICGPSGVGKKTLVEALRDNKQNLRERFGIPADAHIDTFGAGFDPLNDKHTQADYLLWKWQKNNNHLLQELPEQFPDCRHRLICLWLPPELHHQRMLQRGRRKVARQIG
ncbi:MAG: DEAD/DEAH box helicase family protein [Planctomycetota bacterium]|jgi:ribose 1,5-bisphosphokinase PhnN